DVARGALERICQVDLDGGVMVFATGAELLPGGAARAAPEQRRKELAELRFFARGSGAAELEAFVPAGRRLEPPAGRNAGGEIIVGLAFFLVAQDIVGFVDVAHARFGIAFLADIGMVFASQLAVSAADVVLRGVALDAQRAVVVLELHNRPLIVGLRQPSAHRSRQDKYRIGSYPRFINAPQHPACLGLGYAAMRCCTGV